MDHSQREELGKLFASFDVGMLIAMDPSRQLCAHPVALGRFDRDGSLWLAGGIDETPVLEPDACDACMLVCQHGERHLTVSGGVAMELDPARHRSEWLSRWSTWFPSGPEARSLVLARFIPHSAEYWDHTTKRPVRFAVEAARAFMRKAHVPSRRDQHVRFTSKGDRV